MQSQLRVLKLCQKIKKDSAMRALTFRCLPMKQNRFLSSPHTEGFHFFSPAACTSHHTRGACGEAPSNFVGSVTAANTGATGLKAHAGENRTDRSTYTTERMQTVQYQSSSVRTQVFPTWLFTVSRSCSGRSEAHGSLPCCPHSQGSDL